MCQWFLTSEQPSKEEIFTWKNMKDLWNSGKILELQKDPGIAFPNYFNLGKEEYYHVKKISGSPEMYILSH